MNGFLNPLLRAAFLCVAQGIRDEGCQCADIFLVKLEDVRLNAFQRRFHIRLRSELSGLVQQGSGLTAARAIDEIKRFSAAWIGRFNQTAAFHCLFHCLRKTGFDFTAFALQSIQKALVQQHVRQTEGRAEVALGVSVPQQINRDLQLVEVVNGRQQLAEKLVGQGAEVLLTFLKTLKRTVHFL